MIYTVTTNPAIDYHMDLTADGFKPGEINRSAKEEMFPGGKGLNVSVVLAQLGLENTAWAFAAGKTGRMLVDLVRERGCACDFIFLPEGETRINVKLDCEEETAVNGIGPGIGKAQVEQLMEKAKALTSKDVLILSGNLQAGSDSLYAAVCEICEKNKVQIIVDTEGKTLRDTFRCRPFLIKPNEEELTALYDSGEDIPALMKRCRDEGVRNVFVTMGGKGALLLTEEGDLLQAVIRKEIQAVSTVGAGDSAVAGFLAGWEMFHHDYEKALQMACAAGSATASRKWLAPKDDILALLPYVEIVRPV